MIDGALEGGVEEEMGLWKTEAANNKPRIESRCEERRNR